LLSVDCQSAPNALFVLSSSTRCPSFRFSRPPVEDEVYFPSPQRELVDLGTVQPILFSVSSAREGGHQVLTKSVTFKPSRPLQTSSTCLTDHPPFFPPLGSSGCPAETERLGMAEPSLTSPSLELQKPSRFAVFLPLFFFLPSLATAEKTGWSPREYLIFLLVFDHSCTSLFSRVVVALCLPSPASSKDKN